MLIDSSKEHSNGKTIQSLQELKRASSKDIQDLHNCNGWADETDSDTEIIYLDLSSPKKTKKSKKTELASKRIFKLFNQEGVTSSQILRYFKKELKTPAHFEKLLKIKDTNNSSWNVIHYSAKLGFVSVVNYLVSKCSKVDLNKITKNGKTALHLAIEMLHINMIKFLIHNGASILMRDDKGKSPLDLLCEYNLSYLTEIMNSENVQSTLPSTISSHGEKPRVHTTKDIRIHDVNDENVETMFSQIRTYFGENQFLKPKGS